MELNELLPFSDYSEKIFGPPGSGKTTRLLQILQREIDNGVPVDRIGYFTFSNAAADEVSSRLGSKPPWFRTIHSACCRMLGVSGANTLGKREYDLLRRRGWHIQRAGLRFDDGMDVDHGVLINCISMSRNTGRDLREIVREKSREYDEASPRNMARFLEDYEEVKRETGRLDYDDMLARYAFSETPTHPELEVCFIDEAQDLSLLQWRAARQLAAKATRVYIAGDDDQSIYDFLGAAENGFLDYPCTETTVLGRSYRCPAPIGEYASRIITKLKRRQAKDIEWAGHNGWQRMRPALNMEEVHRASLSGTVMLLCRHNYHVADISRELGQAGVPHTVKKEAITTSRRTKGLMAYRRLQRGDSVPSSDVEAMFHVLGDKANARAVRSDRTKESYLSNDLLDRMSFGRDWQSMWGKTQHERVLNLHLRKVIDKNGIDIIGQEPSISVTTMHGSKGLEADHVFAMADCSTRVDDACGRRLPSEVRLAYVATTRSRKTLTIIRSQKRNEMRLLFA